MAKLCTFQFQFWSWKDVVYSIWTETKKVHCYILIIYYEIFWEIIKYKWYLIARPR